MPQSPPRDSPHSGAHFITHSQNRIESSHFLFRGLLKPLYGGSKWSSSQARIASLQSSTSRRRSRALICVSLPKTNGVVRNVFASVTVIIPSQSLRFECPAEFF